MNHQDTKIKANVEQALQEITVPESLFEFADNVPYLYEQQSIETIDEPVRPVKKRRFLWRTLGGCAAGLALFTGSVVYSPSFAAYAKSIPGLSAPVEWLQHAAENIGIQNAKNHGYIPVNPVSIKKEGYTFTIDNVFLERNELRYMFAVQGQKGTTDTFIALPADFPDVPGSGGGEAPRKVSDMEEINIIHNRFDLPEDKLSAFLAKNPKQLTFRIEHRGTGKSFTLPVPFDQTKLKTGKKAAVNRDLGLSQKDPAIEQAVIKSFSADPTKMQIKLDIKLKPGYQIDFTRRSDDWPYLTDETGKKYEFNPNGSEGTLYNSTGTVSLDFMPSVYFDKEPKQLTLHLKKIWLTDTKTFETVEVSTVKFPQTITTHGKAYTFTGTERKQGYWSFDVKKQVHSASNRFDGIIFELPAEDLKKMEKDVTWKKELEKEGGIADNGIIIPKFEHNTDKEIPGEFTMNLYAPKQDTYKLNVRRYEDPVQLDLVLPLPEYKKE